MPKATTEQATAIRYGDLSPVGPGQPLTRQLMLKQGGDWFGSGAAEGYVQSLLEAFEHHNPEAAAELHYIANEAKWATGWKSFGRLILETLA